MSIKKWKNGGYRLDLKIRKEGEIFRLSKVVASVKEAKQLENEFRFRIDNETRLAGFILPDKYKSSSDKSGNPYSINTFYIVFLDENHEFYQT